MKPHILIVDDEVDLLDILAYNLTKSGYEIDSATSGKEAIELIKESSTKYSLILLDVMMGDLNGFETAERIKKMGCTTPIIFLTALDSEGDLLKGFSVGADDYISKPFSVKEVVARAKAVIARTPQKSTDIKIGDLTINKTLKDVTINNEAINLTKTEFMLLLTLAEDAGRIFSREDLINRVWGTECYVEIRTVDVHITRLRKKIAAAGDLIVNRSGYGYCIKI